MAANPSIQLGTDGNWAIKENNLLAYKKDGTRFFNKEFDFTRNTTATFVDKNGLIKESATNTPRIDFTDDATGHLLLEPQSTNLVTYSEDYSQSEWTNVSYTKNAIITYNSNSIAPDGTLGVYQYECTGSGTNSQLGALKVISLGVAYTNSVYLRRINGTGAVKIRDVNNTEKEITADLTSDWKRFEITGTSTSTVGRVYINVLNAGDIIEVWGAQLEQGSYATSYIPTAGSTATRNADVCNNSGSAQDFNSEEGVLYAQFTALADDNTSRTVSINNTSSNRVFLSLRATTCLLYTSPSPRDGLLSRMPSSA